MSPASAHATPRPVDALPATMLKRDFAFVEPLGEGHYGRVSTYREYATGHLFACKRVDLVPWKSASALGQGDKWGASAIAATPVTSAASDIDALRVAQGHSNVIALRAAYADAHSAYILMERCDRGSLLTRACDTGGLYEEEARCVFRQLTSALEHCHERGIVHRDLKPDNVFLTSGLGSSSSSSSSGGSSRSGGGAVRLGDFGLAVVLGKSQKTWGTVGSQPYVAPEVLRGDLYDQSADIWSLGVVLFSVLSASWPTFFPHDGRKRLFDPAKSFSAPVWSFVSTAAKNLIRRMLHHNPHQRPSAREVLQDPWVAQQPLPAVLADAFRAFRSMSWGGQESFTEISHAGISPANLKSGQARPARGHSNSATACSYSINHPLELGGEEKGRWSCRHEVVEEDEEEDGRWYGQRDVYEKHLHPSLARELILDTRDCSMALRLSSRRLGEEQGGLGQNPKFFKEMQPVHPAVPAAQLCSRTAFRRAWLTLEQSSYCAMNAPV